MCICSPILNMLQRRIVCTLSLKRINLRKQSSWEKLASPARAPAKASMCGLNCERQGEACEPEPRSKGALSRTHNKRIFSFACVAKINRVCFAAYSVLDFLCHNRMNLLFIDTLMYRLLGIFFLFPRRKTMSPSLLHE